MRGFSRSKRARRLILPVLLLAAPSLATGTAPTDQTDRDVQIRLEWTGDKPEIWAGVLEMSQGSFANPVSLSTGPDQAGTLWADGQTLWLGRHNPRRDDGFDFSLRAPRFARMCFTLQSEALGGWRRQFEWNLADIDRKPIVFTFGARTGHLSVRRAPGDELRVSIDRPHLIYRSGEIFKAILIPDPNSINGIWSAAKLEWEILASRSSRIVSKGSAPLPQAAYQTTRPRIPIEFPLPEEEGPFDLRFRVHANASNVLESVVQVLVLADQVPGHVQRAHAEVLVDRFRLDNTASTRLEPAVLSTAAISSVERLVGPYLNTPGSLANFGAPEATGALPRREVETWDPFYAGAQRATEYLRSSGDNCLMLPVLAEGSTIYPSAFVERSLRYDSGLLSSSGRDPMQKDVVEMLYRVFDRSGFTLIPELQFSCPLAALERQLASSESAAQGLELVGPDGRPWREVYGSNSRSTPYYNPLDPRVQNAVLDVIREFVGRYHSHPSFRGIAIEIDRRGYLQFPGIEWGCDDATLARFQHETGVHLNDRTHFVADVLNGEARSNWIAWRCGELAGFYRRIARAANSIAPPARVILVCKQTPPAASEIRRCSDTHDLVPTGDLIAQQGLDLSLLEGAPHLFVLPYSSSGSFSIELDRTSPRESFGEALAPIEKTPR
jgi:hypothetical protein